MFAPPDIQAWSLTSTAPREWCQDAPRNQVQATRYKVKRKQLETFKSILEKELVAAKITLRASNRRPFSEAKVTSVK